jgi:uncharacterized protein (DUF427 family)
MRRRATRLAQSMTSGHRIEIEDAPVPVEIRAGGRTLARSTRAKVLRETGLPPRYYLPRDDVHVELVGPTERRTHCPFKGDAIYWSVRVDDDVLDDIAWSYEEPIPQSVAIASHVCFFNERVDVLLDDVAQDRPETVWS